MVQKILKRVLASRHPWRYMNFTDLSEIYVSVLLRTIAIAMISVFVPLYLLKNGYPVTSIFLFYAIFYGMGLLYDIPVAYLIARFGPKHIMRFSFLLQTVFSFMLIEINNLPLPIFSLAAVSSLASALYFLPYHISLSKIKSAEHCGKELSFLQIMERLGGILGPLVGGAVATYVNPHLTFLVAGLAMFLAAIILMLSPEPMQTKQKIRFAGMRLRDQKINYFSFAVFGLESSISLYLWPIYLSVVVFSFDAYLKLGSISSVSVLAAILVLVPLGRILDKQKSKDVLNLSTTLNALLHIVRPFISTFGGAMMVSVLNEPNTSAYRMAYLKGYYNEADEHPGYRIAFITSNEVIADILRTVSWTLLYVASVYAPATIVCAIGFGLGSLASLGIRLAKYRTLR